MASLSSGMSSSAKTPPRSSGLSLKLSRQTESLDADAAWMNALLTPESARCEIRTYKAGALSALGHDLLLRIERFELERNQTQLIGSFDISSISVVGAICNGQLSPDTLSERDRRKINRVISSVLEPKRFPTAELTCEMPENGIRPGQLRGQLTLKKTTRWIDVDITKSPKTWSCKVRLHQADFHIRPYRAVMGALRIKPEVDVHFVFDQTALEESTTRGR
jgi:hypothetical protein